MTINDPTQSATAHLDAACPRTLADSPRIVSHPDDRSTPGGLRPTSVEKRRPMSTTPEQAAFLASPALCRASSQAIVVDRINREWSSRSVFEPGVPDLLRALVAEPPALCRPGCFTPRVRRCERSGVSGVAQAPSTITTARRTAHHRTNWEVPGRAPMSCSSVVRCGDESWPNERRSIRVILSLD